MRLELSRALETAMRAARRAGQLLRDDLHRAGGPRGHVDKAEADTEAERIIRRRLADAFPGWGYLGEETGSAPGDPGAPVWLVDPNDGTRDYLKGRRGSSVSIGLLVDRQPCLGVIYAFSYPDDDGDLFAWASGCGPPKRNGEAVEKRLPEVLGPSEVVLVSSAGDSDVSGNLSCISPARYRTVPSIAHRLALASAGEGAVAVSLNRPCSWDYGAGHALLRGAGATLLDESGAEVTYTAEGRSACVRAFGGRAEVAGVLPPRAWQTVGMHATDAEEEGHPVRLERGEIVADARLLSRAQGCLLGQIAGDSLGALVEFRSQEEVVAAYPSGPRTLTDGGVWDTLAGQPTDDSEMALALARAVVSAGGFDREAVLRAYEGWLRSAPFDVGSTVRKALLGRPDSESQANGSLMRASPIGVLGHALPAAEAAEVARQDSALTHPNPVCGDAAGAFVVAIAHAIGAGDGAEAAWEAALQWVRESGASVLVREALLEARREPPVCDGKSQGWVRVALQNAFYELLHAPGVEEGVVATVRRGGDADTNAAVAGALLGAVHGRPSVPEPWRSAILSCRPAGSRSHRPRPRRYWPTDALEIAERLLLAGAARAPAAR